jgi:hypothetical protein
MTTLTDDVKEYLEPAIRAKCINRADVGLFAFAGSGNDKTSIKDVFSYSDTVAIAALINKGSIGRDAAAYVSKGLVAASPHYAGNEVEEWIEHEHQLHVGFYRLADGGIWSVSADLDTSAIKPSDILGDFLIVAARGTSIVDEQPTDRARHLLSECDARGVVVKPM